MSEHAKMICVGGVWIPQKPAEKVGLGCPKCDDSEIIPVHQNDHNVAKLTTAFVKRHKDCGDLETLEVQGGRLIVTGWLKRSVVLS